VEAKIPCLGPSFPWAEGHSDRVHIQDVETMPSGRRDRQKRKLWVRIRDPRSIVVGVHTAEAKARDLMWASTAGMPIHRGKMMAMVEAKDRDT
jgi:hypothetical protein